MSLKNRTELASAISGLSAVVDLSELKSVLDDIKDSLLAGKDVTNTITVPSATTQNVDFSGYDAIRVSTATVPSATTQNVDFSGYDAIRVSTAYDCTLNIQNVNDGEVKYLYVSKTAGIQVLFTGATDMSLDVSYINTLTDVVYLVTKKIYTTVIVNPIVKDFDKSLYYLKTETYSATEADALLAAKQNALTEETTASGTIVGAYIDSGTFTCKFIRYGKMVFCTGQLKFNTLPGSPGTAIIDIPAAVGTPKIKTYLIGGISTGVGRPVFDAYINASGTQILFNTGDNGYLYSFNFMFVND